MANDLSARLLATLRRASSTHFMPTDVWQELSTVVLSAAANLDAQAERIRVLEDALKGVLKIAARNEDGLAIERARAALEPKP